MKYLSQRNYHIQFTGSVLLDRPLQPAQTAYLQRFFATRRIMWLPEKVQDRADPLREAVNLPLGEEGAYFVGLSFDELSVPDWRPLVANQNKPPQGQPFLWCFWRLDEDGVTLRYVDEIYELYWPVSAILALDTEQLRMVVSIQAHSQENEEQGNIMKQRVLLQQISEVLVIAHSPAANALHGAQ
jgi:hypothetical protein